MSLGEATKTIPNNPSYGVPIKTPVQTLTDDGAITLVAGGVVELDKAGVIAATLALPQSDGCWLVIQSKTAQAHTVTVSGGLNGLGAGEDVGTFGGAVSDGCILVSINGYWTQAANTNVTFA